MFPKRGRNKFGAKRTEVSGQWFDSKLEGDMFQILLDMQEDGRILEIARQQTVKLTKAQIGWRVDFKIVTSDGQIEYIEAKGVDTETYLLKKKLYYYYGKHKLSIWKRKGTKELKCVEVIIPEGIE